MRAGFPSRKLKALLVSGVYLILLCLSMVCAAAEDTYKLKRVFKPGEVDRYKTEMTIEDTGGVFKLVITVLVSETVKEIRSNGNTVVEFKCESATMKTGDVVTPLPGGIPDPVTTTYAESGKILPDKHYWFNWFEDRGLASMLSLTYPLIVNDKPLKIGEELKLDAEATGSDFITSKTTLALVKMEKAGPEIPVETLKLKVIQDLVLPGDDGNHNVHIDGAALIEPGTGKILLSTGKMTGLHAPNIGDHTITFKRTRIKAEDKKADKPNP